MLAIDTLKLAEDLKASGFDEKQTSGLVDLGRTMSDQALEHIATKEDLALLEERTNAKLDTLEERTNAKLDTLEERTNARFDTLEERVNAKLDTLEHRMTIRLGGLMIAGIGFLVMMDRLFPASGG